RAADLAALERRTKGDRTEHQRLAAEDALDVLDPHTLHAERRRVLLRIHLKRAAQKPHQMWLPLDLSMCNDHWEDLAHQPRRVLSEERTKQVHEYLVGAGMDYGRRLLHMSTYTLDPSGQCCKQLACVSARDVRGEPLGPGDAQMPGGTP